VLTTFEKGEQGGIVSITTLKDW